MINDLREPPEGQVRCRQCGNYNEETAAHCLQCGRALWPFRPLPWWRIAARTLALTLMVPPGVGGIWFTFLAFNQPFGFDDLAFVYGVVLLALAWAFAYLAKVIAGRW